MAELGAKKDEEPLRVGRAKNYIYISEGFEGVEWTVLTTTPITMIVSKYGLSLNQE